MIDSLRLAYLLVKLEKKFKIKINDFTLKLEKVSDITLLVASKMK
jgi:acyl carrier protein